MKIADKIYGVFEVEEPVILGLLKSSSLLRLKNVSQYGIPDKYYLYKNYSRLEHSIGVMLLLRKLGADIEEQIAGLLHDVSTPAFSHIADWVFGQGENGNEDYHNNLHKKFVLQSDLPKLLKRYGFSDERILDESNFPLLERGIPDLCADRIDYALREFFDWLNPSIVEVSLDKLSNYKGEIIFSDAKIALRFAKSFLELQRRHFADFDEVVRYHLFSKALRIAVEKNILGENDFFKDEEFLMEKVERAKDKDIVKVISRLGKKRIKKIAHPEGKKLVKKFRFVDPKVLVKGNLKRLSELSSDFKKLLDERKEINEKGVMV